MIAPKAATKRGRPKRKNSDADESSEEFVKKKAPKKTQKAAAATKKAQQTQKKTRKKAPPRNKIESSQSSESESEESVEVKEEPVAKVITISLEPFKPDKLFAEILNKANKQPDFLIMLRNLLSGCSRILRDKKNFLRKKWEQLRNSNCTQDEYISRQSELKRMEIEEIYEIEKDIMSKLSYANIKGFEAKESLIEQYKHSVGANDNAGKTEPQPEYIIEDEVWNAYHDLQKKLLSLLMNEKDLVYSNSMDHGGIGRLSGIGATREGKSTQDNQMEMKFNNIETQQNPQTTQFLFCKHFSEINYDKVFENHTNPFKLNENDIYYMDPKALSWILETKSDEVYTNEKFQNETFKRYTEILRSIYNRSSDFTDEQLIENLLQVAAYILNSVHYYQKFKLKCDLLHPLDLLLVIQRIKKDRKRQNAVFAMQQNFEKDLEALASSMKEISDSVHD